MSLDDIADDTIGILVLDALSDSTLRRSHGV